MSNSFLELHPHEGQSIHRHTFESALSLNCISLNMAIVRRVAFFIFTLLHLWFALIILHASHIPPIYVQIEPRLLLLWQCQCNGCHSSSHLNNRPSETKHNISKLNRSRIAMSFKCNQSMHCKSE